MGKATYLGLVPPDDPMFSGGPQLFSPRASSPSSTTSPAATTRATPASSTSDKLPPKPTRDQFATDQEFDEALGGWNSRVGRILAMSAKSAGLEGKK